MKQLIIAVKVTILFTLITGLAYPLVVTRLARVLFPHQANGSLIIGRDGVVHGSGLIGQQFTADKYFHSRPSDAGANGMAYDPTSSGGSNLGPTSQKLRDTVAQNVSDYRTQNGLGTNAPVPADAVTASASGLDPHISVLNAALQTPRVANARGLTKETIEALVRANTDAPSLGFLGEPGVNVLRLKLALDAQVKAAK